MLAIESLYQTYLKHPNICTDTRKIEAGCLFFALKGEHFDANQFAAKALELGAAYVIIDNPDFALNSQCLLVSDVLEALQALAKMHREQFNIPFIGLTGSNGKTTSKELIHAVLQRKFKSYATKGNLNNHIGVPLTILSLPSDTEIAIIEMGANHQKEIEFLCTIAQPTHGLITNIGRAHLEGFGGFEGVKKGKSELYTYLKANNGQVFIDQDNPILIELSEKLHLEGIHYGTSENNLVNGELIANDPYLVLSWKKNSDITKSYLVNSQLTGSYNFSNMLAAICIGTYFNMSAQDIIEGLENYKPQNNRSQIEKTANNTVICDYYNANPSSMEVALQNLAKLQAHNKTIILGAMFELGEETGQQHQIIHDLALSFHFDHNIFIGEAFYKLAQSDQAKYFKTPSEAELYLQEKPLREQMILLKGSRGMALEKLMPFL